MSCIPSPYCDISITVTSGLSYITGDFITLYCSNCDHISGQVVSYNIGTGALVFTPLSYEGTGTCCDWTINLSGAPGVVGTSGTSGTSATSGTSGTTGSSGTSGSSGLSISLSAIGSVPNADGASLTGNILNLQPANASFGGVATTGPQTFAGAKTFNSDLTVNGINVGKGNNSVASNTSIGASALSSNTTGLVNTAIGNSALNANTDGNFNTAVGVGSLQYNISGISNSALGYVSLSANISGGQNSAFGNLSLTANTTGSGNTALGYSGLSNNISGSNNTAIGYLSGGTLTTGSGNTFIGANVVSGSISLANNILIGNGTGAVKAQHDGTNWTLTGGTTITGVLTLNSTITNGTYTYTLPSATGTLALTSALSGYLPLTGGTLTGALSGTSATFTGTSGTTLTTNGVSGQWSTRINGNSTAGSSYGLGVYAGTNSSDDSFRVHSYSGTEYFAIRGDGAATFAGKITQTNASQPQFWQTYTGTGAWTSEITNYNDTWNFYDVTGVASLLNYTRSTGTWLFPKTTASSSTTTGALVVSGGVGIGGALTGTTATFTGASGAHIGVTSTVTDATGSSRFRATATGSNIVDMIVYSASHASRANQAWIGGDGSTTVTVLQAAGVEFLRGTSAGATTLAGALSGTTFTGTGLVINNNGEALRAYGTSPNVSFYNAANTTRGGYVNHDGSNMNIVANVGSIVLGTAVSATGGATINDVFKIYSLTTSAGVVLQGYTGGLRIAVNGSGETGGTRGDLLAASGDFSGKIAFSANSGATASGQIGRDATYGMFQWASSGATDDWTVFSPSLGYIMHVPTGTVNTVFAGNTTSSSIANILGSDGGGKQLRFIGGVTTYNGLIAVQENYGSTLEITASSAVGTTTFNRNIAKFNLSDLSVTFSGQIASTRGNSGATVLGASTATTGGQKIDLINTSGRIMMGIEDSAGGSEVNGAPAYSSYLSSVNAQPLVFATSNTVRLTIASTGAATFSSSVTATGFFESSSVKGKDIMQTNPLTNLNLDVIQYTRKKDENKDVRYGYSAEQIHLLMPELTDKDVTAVKYLDVHTILIAQLQQEIKELKAKLN